MSSNISVQKVCEYCGNEFTAHKTTSKTCSHKCASKLYKQKQRTAKIENTIAETKFTLQKPIEELKAKEFLSIPEAVKLLGISRRSLYRMLERGELVAGKAGGRTIVQRTHIDKLFN